MYRIKKIVAMGTMDVQRMLTVALMSPILFYWFAQLTSIVLFFLMLAGEQRNENRVLTDRPSRFFIVGANPTTYSQPPSKKQEWFDFKKSNGFVQKEMIRDRLIGIGHNNDKWIVITTINPPTPTIKRLASLQGWSVVVIGDSKTPKDWSLPNTTYLSIEKQISLGFSTTQLLRERSYQRKNIGYLYAILHGARVIYETDDDNELISEDIPFLESNKEPVLEYVSKNLVINHHAHFHQPSTWPRGYPLEAISLPHVTTVHERQIIPAVQQGLANGDPDLDSIFRLTRKPHDVSIDFSFSQNPPIALPFGSFGPYNAQNTIFIYEGLWAAVLPQTVEFRVCDIWRSYFTQRLMWGIGCQLVFAPPYVKQIRNSHSYYDDYVSEKQIFDQVTALLQWLRNWECPQKIKHDKSSKSESLLPHCAVSLAKDMAIEGYWGPEDAELVRHYFFDLKRMNYSFPLWIRSNDSYELHLNMTKTELVYSERSITLNGTCVSCTV